MTSRLIHRGPDDEGYWIDSDQRLAFGHRRLSIIDLTAEGHQPMLSKSGRFVIAFNGEIYNFLELRMELEKLGERFRGRSDTEVLLSAIENWGVEAALKKCVGMFAFALWDKAEKRLFLARDRIGEKPLYYGWTNKTFFFGSELKALKAHPLFETEIDRNSLALYLRYNYVPAPYSIYKNFYKLLPGSILSFSAESGLLEEPIQYWSAKAAINRAQENLFVRSEEEAVERLHALLSEAVRNQMISDVPLGAFLSGGIDSSLIVALMQAQTSKKVKTFTIGFFEEAFDEAKSARKVAEHLQVEHTELMVSPREAMSVIPKLCGIYDEPFSDSSQVPTFLVSQLARKSVTVSLSGDGGDEIFGGYNRYLWGPRIWNRIRPMPLWLRTGLSSSLEFLSPDTWDHLFSVVNPLLPKNFRFRLPGLKVQKFAESLRARSELDFYLGRASHWAEPKKVVLNSVEKLTLALDSNLHPRTKSFAEKMMVMDLLTYLPDDILTKVDRAAMAVSLESRIPFLDHRVVEFAWSLPMEFKIRGGEGKWILKEVLSKYIPRDLFERPKMGFGVPINKWLRGAMRPWAEELLSEGRLASDGFFDPAPILKKWTEHQRGDFDWSHHLWDVLMFQDWLHQVKSGDSIPNSGIVSFQ
jgi:asparagine synthase (glutamine-hydrolysing)